MGGSKKRINASQAHRLTGSHHDEICEWLSLALLFIRLTSFKLLPSSSQSAVRTSERRAASCLSLLFISYSFDRKSFVLDCRKKLCLMITYEYLHSLTPRSLLCSYVSWCHFLPFHCRTIVGSWGITAMRQ